MSRNRNKPSLSHSSNQYYENNDSSCNTSRQERTDVDHKVMNSNSEFLENDGTEKTEPNYSDTELPRDCLEITYEEAVKLGGFFDDTSPRAMREHSGTA